MIILLRRNARQETENAISLGYWVHWSTEVHILEYEQEFQEVIDIVKAPTQWMEEPP